MTQVLKQFTVGFCRRQIAGLEQFGTLAAHDRGCLAAQQKVHLFIKLETQNRIRQDPLGR
ncbi:hypothetical protein D3C72_2434520 [compost metagenome]